MLTGRRPERRSERGPGRRLLPRTLLAFALVAFAGASCARTAAEDDRPVPAVPGGAYSVALTEPDHLTPGRTTSSYALQVLQGVFDTPLALDPQDGHPVPLAASSLTSTDQQVWTMTLRQGAVFQNGEPVTAAGFAAAWDAAAYGPSGWDANSYFTQIAGYDDLNPPDGRLPTTRHLSGLQVLDDHTLRVTLKAPFSQFPMLLSFPAFAPLPQAAFTDPDGFDLHPVGNGPFQLDGPWRHNQRIDLKRAASYTGPRPPMADAVHFRIFTSKDTAFTELRAGHVDFVTSVPAARAYEAKRTFGRHYAVRPSGTMDYLGLPIWDPRYANPQLRRAISMAIDRPGITRAIYNEVFTPADSLVGATIPGHRAGACGETCEYRPTEARQLFQQAGGFTGTLALYFANSDPTYLQWMTAVANELRQNLGIRDVALRTMAAADLGPILNHHQATGPYRQNWVADYPSEQNYLAGLLGPGTRSGWSDPAFNALLAQGDAAATAEQSIAHYHQAEDLALQQLPLIPLWNWQDQTAWSGRVGNVQLDPYAAGLRLEQITVRH
ncbi:ABC-type oligopeptide transport system substrate-binding subunit [Kitasatospora sp. GAS204A]|uniref:peptide ABC transporter substrate-binding protein n=1 Tax=unclassified Kitasatospora TaxID=2633591 RepID=UPI0024756135|nr:ABC transporter substrate-binding protein [Kitasatospora sp. GAS204B]MDH6122678.1 ABC-type oligopeptide transport system substrate-binding subunit [Kitasatospora sp. GAS204B]